MLTADALNSAGAAVFSGSKTDDRHIEAAANADIALLFMIITSLLLETDNSLLRYYHNEYTNSITFYTILLA
jgi:hypothetical protein